MHWGLYCGFQFRLSFSPPVILKLVIICWRRLLRVPWTARRSKPVNPKQNQPWIFIGRTDAEAEASILWLPDVKSQLIGKDPDAEKDWRHEEKGMAEDKIVRWHKWFNAHEFEQTLGVDDGQGGLVCCSPWGCKDRTRLSNWPTKHVSQENWANTVCWTPFEDKFLFMKKSLTSMFKNRAQNFQLFPHSTKGY